MFETRRSNKSSYSPSSGRGREPNPASGGWWLWFVESTTHCRNRDERDCIHFDSPPVCKTCKLTNDNREHFHVRPALAVSIDPPPQTDSLASRAAPPQA